MRFRILVMSALVTVLAACGNPPGQSSGTTPDTTPESSTTSTSSTSTTSTTSTSTTSTTSTTTTVADTTPVVVPVEGSFEAVRASCTDGDVASFDKIVALLSRPPAAEEGTAAFDLELRAIFIAKDDLHFAVGVSTEDSCLRAFFGFLPEASVTSSGSGHHNRGPGTGRGTTPTTTPTSTPTVTIPPAVNPPPINPPPTAPPVQPAPDPTTPPPSAPATTAAPGPTTTIVVCFPDPCG